MFTDFFRRRQRDGGEGEVEKERRGEGEIRGKGGGRKNIYQLPSACTPTSDQTHNLGMCSDRESNPQHFGVWYDAPVN